MTTPEALARLAKILRLRDAATPGPWFTEDRDTQHLVWGGAHTFALASADSYPSFTNGPSREDRAFNAAFIAAAHDLASIAEHLRDEVATLDECNRSLLDERDVYKSDLVASRERERKLAEELEAVQKDAERYRWLRNDSQTAESHTPTVHVWHGGFVIIGNAHLDAAIDAAIQADTGAKP